jgi:hypothetical protein
VKALKMQLRPPARLLASVGALVLATTLTSCGFDYATDRVYTPAEGVNDRDASVDVLGAVVVSGQEGSGTFIASFANNDQSESATVESLRGAGEDSSLQVEDFQPIEIAPGQMVNLATEGGIVVRGDFEPGNFLTVEVGFGDGETVEMDIPSVPPCDEFTGLDRSAKGSSATESDLCTIESPETEH